MAVVYLCSPANPQGAIAGLDYLQKLIAKCRQHDAVLAVDECYAEIYTGEAPVGGLEAALAMDETGGKDPFRNVAVFHSLSKRSNAAGLRSGFMAGDPRLVAMLLRWRTYGGPQIPFAVQKASAALWREETHPLETREWYRKNFRVAEQILHNRFGYYTPGGGFFLWLDVGDGEDGHAQAVGRGASQGAARLLRLPRDRRRQHRRALHPRRAGARREDHPRGDEPPRRGAV